MRLVHTEGEAYDFTISVAAGQLNLYRIASWSPSTCALISARRDHPVGWWE